MAQEALVFQKGQVLPARLPALKRRKLTATLCRCCRKVAQEALVFQKGQVLPARSRVCCHHGGSACEGWWFLGGKQGDRPQGGNSTGSPAHGREREGARKGSAGQQSKQHTEKERKGKAVRAVQKARTAVHAANDSDDSETRFRHKAQRKGFFFFFCGVSGHGYSTWTQARHHAALVLHAAKDQKTCSQASKILECCQGTAKAPTAAKGPETQALVLTETANQKLRRLQSHHAVQTLLHSAQRTQTVSVA